MDSMLLSNVDGILCPWLKMSVGDVCLGDRSQCWCEKNVCRPSVVRLAAAKCRQAPHLRATFPRYIVGRGFAQGPGCLPCALVVVHF